jgi:hypothetical protein
MSQQTNDVAATATTVAELATQLGVSTADAQQFVDCLAVWVAKGYTVEQAIAANLRTLAMLAGNVSDAMLNEHSRHTDSLNALKGAAVEWFYAPQQAAA